MSTPASAAPGTTFVTGFPGFVARHLLRRLLEAHPDERFLFLVESRMVARAEDDLAALERTHPDLAGRWDLVVGDITERHLGLTDDRYEDLTSKVNRVWHLAAIYNLAVAERVAYKVNVVGTINVLDLCEDAEAFDRLNYVSTCYVSGQRRGLIREAELDEGQGFKNHYESTKFWAEVEVQRRWRRIPTAVFRPGIIVGDSTTGETDKYDGPYYIMKLLQRLPDGLPFVNVGEGDSAVNIVPIDFAVDAMVAISQQPESTGEVFHVADPNPMRAEELLDLMLKIMGKPPAVASVPSLLVESVLKLQALQDAVGVPREVIAYFNHDARYDTTHTLQALEGTGVRCPHLSSYLDTLIDYMRRHPRPG